MSLYNVINETQLRQTTGPDLFSDLERALLAGQVRQRYQVSNNAIAAKVQSNGHVHRSLFFINDGQNFAQCTCEESTHGLCPHVLAMLLAWVREPTSFAPNAAPAGFEVELAHRQFDLPPKSKPRTSKPAKQTSLVYDQHFKLLGVNELRQLAERYRLPVGALRREALVTAVQEGLNQPGVIQAAINRLTPEMRRMMTLFELLDFGEGLPAYQINQHVDYLQIPHLVTQPGKVLDALCETGLLVRLHDHYSLLQSARPYLPPDSNLLPKFEAPLPTPPADSSVPSIALPSLMTHVLLLAQTGLLVGATPPRPVSPTPGRGRRQTPAPPPLNPPLLSPQSMTLLHRATQASAEQLEYVLHLLIDLHVLEINPRQVVRVNSGPQVNFMHQPMSAQVQMLLKQTLTRTSWSELGLASNLAGDAIVIQPGASTSAIEALNGFLTQNRNFHASLLRQAAPNQWVDFEAYLSLAWRLSAVGPGVERRRTRRNGRSQEEAIHHAVGYALFVGPWQWLGLIELAKDENGPVAFRMTPVGAHLLHHPNTLAAVPEMDAPGDNVPALYFRAAGQLGLNPYRAEGSMIDLLGMIGQPLLDDDGVLYYQLHSAGAAQAFGSGHTPTSLVKQLSAWANQPVPHWLNQQINDWYTRYGQVQLYNEVALIELADDYALAELQANTSLAQHVFYQFNPRLVAVDPAAVDALMAEFELRGYTPKRMDGE